MSRNFIKSSSVVSDRGVRIIQSNDIVAKKLEDIATIAHSDRADDIKGAFAEGIDATFVASVLNDDSTPQSSSDPLDGILGGKGVSSENLKAQNMQAANVLAKAEADAQEIKTKAEAEAETLKENAYKEGKAEGYEDGMREAKLEIARLENEITEKSKALDSEYNAKVAEIEPALVDVITGVYEHIFKISLLEHREIVIHLINSTLAHLDGVKTFLIHISKDDYPFISMQKKALVAGTGIAVENIELVEDFAVSKGNCIIETDGGIFDCGVDTHLEALGKELKLLSYKNN